MGGARVYLRSGAPIEARLTGPKEERPCADETAGSGSAQNLRRRRTIGICEEPRELGIVCEAAGIQPGGAAATAPPQTLPLSLRVASCDCTADICACSAERRATSALSSEPVRLDTTLIDFIDESVTELPVCGRQLSGMCAARTSRSPEEVSSGAVERRSPPRTTYSGGDVD